MRGLSCSPQRSKTPAMQSMHNLPKFIIVKRHNREVQVNLVTRLELSIFELHKKNRCSDGKAVVSLSLVSST